MDTSDGTKKKTAVSIGQRGGFFFLKKKGDTSTTEIGNCRIVRTHMDGTADVKLPDSGNRFGLPDVLEKVEVGTTDENGQTRTDYFFVPRERVGAPTPGAPVGYIGPTDGQRLTDLEARCASSEGRLAALERELQKK